MTAAEYLHKGVKALDGEFGEGYAARHPELLAAFMRTAALDFQTSVCAAVAQDLLDAWTHRASYPDTERD